MGAIRVADRIGIGRSRSDLLHAEPQLLRYQHGHARTCPRHIHRPCGQGDGAIGVDTDRTGGPLARIPPITMCHTTPTMGTFKRCAVVGMAASGPEYFTGADPGMYRPIDPPGALLRAVHQPELQRIHTELLRQLIHHHLDGEGSLRSAGCTIGPALGLVDDNIISVDLAMGHIIGGEGHTGGRLDKGPWIGPGLVVEVGLGGSDSAIARRPNLDMDHRSWRRTCGQEHLGSGHDHLDRSSGFSREQCDQRLHIVKAPTTESPTELGGDNADL